MTCNVAPMQDGHILLGRHWLYDREVTHQGRTNQYLFYLNNCKFTFAHLDLKKIHAMQAKGKASASTKVSFFAEKTLLPPDQANMMHLSLLFFSKTGFRKGKEHTVTTNNQKRTNQEEHLIWTRSNTRELSTPCS